MITISRETDYAARVILHLALLGPDARTTAQDIAAQRLIPRALVRRVVTRLAAAGFVLTTRGSDGGISLARAPEAISLVDVVEAMEGPLALNVCTVSDSACPLTPQCAVHDAWSGAREVLMTHMRQVTFDRLAQGRAGQGKEACEAKAIAET